MATEEVSPLLKGRDRSFLITVKDKAGVVIDITGLAELLIYIAYNPNKFLQRYSLNAKTDFDDIEVVDGPNGKVRIRLQSKDTENADVGRIFAEAMTETVDATYDDSTLHLGGLQDLKTEIVESLSRKDL